MKTDTPQQPTTEQLLDWLEGRLTQQEAEEVARKLAKAGPEGQRRLAWVQAFLQIKDDVTLDEPPYTVRQHLRAAFSTYARQRRETDERPGLLQRLVANLSFDSQWQPALSGVRSEAESMTRQLLYVTTGAEIALTLQSEVDLLHLLGQMVPLQAQSSEPFLVQLLEKDREVRSAQTGPGGTFSLLSIPPGEYQLVLSNPQLSVVLPNIDLYPPQI